MSANPVSSPEVRFKLAARVGQRRRGILDRLRQSRSQRRGQMMTDCFGKLADRDEMVVKGLLTSLARSTERGQGRW